MTKRKIMSEPENLTELERFFAAAKADRPSVPAALLDAVLRDANARQPAPRPLARPGSDRRRSWAREVWAGLGGWASAGVLSACLLVGVGVGLVSPGGLDGLTDTWLIGDGFDASAEFDFTLDDILAEG
jgi:hypothetical protein